MFKRVTLSGLSVRAHRWIAKHRQTRLIQSVHQLAAYVESAYANEEWDLAVNGEAALLGRLAPADFTSVVDVGAHIGDWTIAALRAWPRAHVHAFEVAPQTYERLTTHMTAHGLASRSTLTCAGLGECSQRREMYYYPDHPNLTCDTPRHRQHRSIAFQANILTGDDYVERNRIERINFVKIDVEGAEPLVIRGFERTIASGRIDCIQFEYGAFSIDTRVLLIDYYRLLDDQYWIGKIYPNHVDFREYEWKMEDFRFSNFVCVSRARPDLLALARGSPASA